MRARVLLRPRILAPLSAVLLFFFGGWTLRNKLAAARQGEWARATRGDLVTGIDVTGTLAAVDSDLIVWDSENHGSHPRFRMAKFT